MGSKTELFVRKQSGGMFTVVNESMTTGDIFWVDDSGTDSVSRGANPTAPLKTIDYAIGRCTAGKGDIIYVMPGHAETVTSAITMDIEGVSIIGLGEGNRRPVITPNGAIDAITMTAAGCKVENIRLAAPGTDAQTADINIAAAGCVVRNTHHIGSTTAKNKVDIITITADGDYALLDGVEITNATVDVEIGIELEGAANGVVVQNCVVQGAFSTAAIGDSGTATLVTVKDSIFKNDKAATAVLKFDTGNSTGVCQNLAVSGRHTTIASNIACGTGMDFFQVFTTEEAAKNGAIIPAADAE
jgi:hypothetical protein